MQIGIPTQVSMWIWWRLVSSTRLKWLEQPYWMLQGPLYFSFVYLNVFSSARQSSCVEVASLSFLYSALVSWTVENLLQFFDCCIHVQSAPWILSLVYLYIFSSCYVHGTMTHFPLLFSYCSVSSLLTTTESVIVEIPKEESSASAMGSMNGMEYWRAFSAHAKAMWLYETLV